MEPLQPLSDLGRVTPTPRDPQRNRRGSQSFDAEFDQSRQSADHQSPDPTPSPHKRLQLEPPLSRKTPSDGEFHIDVLA